MLNKTMSNFRLAALGVAVAGSMMATQAAAEDAVEVAASVAISNMYLWRGNDLGDGTPAISGDINASMAGLYGGLWASSGDTASGTEYDIYAGYGGEIEGLSYDLMLITYVYPDGNAADDNIGDLSEVILSLGFGPVSFSYYDNIAGFTGYEYYTLGASAGSFSATLGYHDLEADDSDATHLDLSYAYNDNLSFTMSKMVDTPSDAVCAAATDLTYTGCDDDMNFVVSYSLPIDMK